MKSRSSRLLLCTLLAVPLLFSCAEEEQAPVVSVDWIDPERTSDGYTLVMGSSGSIAHWIGMDGSIARTLELPRLGALIKQLPSGAIFLLCSKGLVELDVRGQILWQYLPPVEEFMMHHDFLPTPEGNVFVIGQRHDLETGLALDSIREVSRDKEVVWRWEASDHFSTDDLPPYAAKSVRSKDWLHLNSLDRFPDGDLLVSVRNRNEIIRIDYPTGNIIWRWGDGILAHQHAARVLANGNITLFDNGIYRNKKICDKAGCVSRALEMNPRTGKIVWQFRRKGMFSMGFGDVARLPNGNTLITYGQQSPRAKLIEVTREGEIVWSLEYNVLTTSEIVDIGPRAALYRSSRVLRLP